MTRDALPLFVVLALALIGAVVARFAARYLHRERKRGQFFALLALALGGLVRIAAADDLAQVLTGWELVGLASVLLIAFHDERPAPVDAALWALGVYKIGDVALALAPQAVFLAAVAIAVKSAQLPFSGWLVRAMEGPTPSSAVFYGALAVHAGPLLALRLQPTFTPEITITLICVGLASALYGALVGRAQVDAKSQLACASIAQLGLILAEVALGFRLLVALHIVGHASLRTYQLLRAPSALADHRHAVAALGALPATGVHYEAILPAPVRRRLYRAALMGGHLDELISQWVLEPARVLLRRLDRLEEDWMTLEDGEIVTEARPEPAPVATRAKQVALR